MVSLCPSRWRVTMIELFITSLRLARSVTSAFRRDPQFRFLVFLVIITLLSGTLFYSQVEGWSVVDALYFSVTTLTTVGLGDLAPTTTIGKLFTVVYIFSGLGLIAGFITTIGMETLSRRARRQRNDADQEDPEATSPTTAYSARTPRTGNPVSEKNSFRQLSE